MVRPAGWTVVPVAGEQEALQPDERADGEEGLDRGRAGGGHRPGADRLLVEADELPPDEEEEREVERLHRPPDGRHRPVRVAPAGGLRRRRGSDGDELGHGGAGYNARRPDALPAARLDVLPDETHDSVFPGAVSNGLRFLLPGPRPP